MAKWKSIIKAFIKKFNENNVTLLAASQAYYYLLSIFPLLIVCFAMIPYINLDTDLIIESVDRLLPSGMADIFEDNIISLIQTPKGGLLTVGIIGALWSASNGVNAFIKSINQAYEIEESRSFIIVRLISLGLTIGLIVALGVAIALPILGNAIITYLRSFIALNDTTFVLLQFMRLAVSIVVLTGLLLLLYRYAPNKELPIKHILPGALIASIFWLIISFGFSFYIDNFANYSATYGSLGGVIILMIWFYLTGLLLMVGALINVLFHELNQPL